MAKIYPEEVSNLVRKDPKLNAEIKVYDALREQCRSSWLIFYHVAWLQRIPTEEAPRDRETDFIIAHPEYGILLIEVKGGGIRYEGVRRQWISTDREGIDHDIDPFAQVVRCKYALINKLKSLPHWSQRWIEVGHAVAFPDSYLAHNTLPPEAPAEIIIDARDLSHLPERITQIFRYWHGQQSSLEKPDPALLRDLERIIAPTIKLRNPLSIQVNDDEREIIRLTEEQYRLLTMLSKTRRAAISGCAGSGKTMMAIEKAKRLANEGFRTLLTCYNRPLSEYLQAIAGKRENLIVCTFHQLCSRMAREADISLPPTDGKQKTSVFEQDYPNALYEAMTMRPDLRFDAIIVDEGQDFADTWWIALDACLVEGRESIFYVFYDDNQRIYRNRGNIPTDLGHFPLTENVRNTRMIYRALSSYYESENPSSPRGPVGRSIERYPYVTDGELRKTLSQALIKLVKTEEIRTEDIVILTPRSLHVSGSNPSILLQLKLDGGFKLVPQLSRLQAHEIACSTIHSFKGLERPVIIVVELDEQFLAGTSLEKITLRDMLCYVAFSRPRSHLILMGNAHVIAEILPTVR